MPFIKERPLQQARRGTLQSVIMRSGTSRGLFLHQDHLPQRQADWSPILLAAMGSATGDKRQVDAVGGETSTTSKAAIVGPSAREDADVDYTFAQVAVGNRHNGQRRQYGFSSGAFCCGRGASSSTTRAEGGETYSPWQPSTSGLSL